MKCKKWIVMGIMLVSMMGCVSEREAYQQAEEHNTIQGYQDFLAKYEKGEFTNEAKKQLAEKTEELNLRRIAEEKQKVALENEKKKVMAQALGKLNSYQTGVTTFGEFSQDFDVSRASGRWGSRGVVSSSSDTLSILQMKKRLDFPQGQQNVDMALEAFQASVSGAHTSRFDDYVSGEFIMGFLATSGGPTSYAQSPERFTVAATLTFEKGILVKKEMNR